MNWLARSTILRRGGFFSIRAFSTFSSLSELLGGPAWSAAEIQKNGQQAAEEQPIVSAEKLAQVAKLAKLHIEPGNEREAALLRDINLVLGAAHVVQAEASQPYQPPASSSPSKYWMPGPTPDDLTPHLALHRALDGGQSIESLRADEAHLDAPEPERVLVAAAPRHAHGYFEVPKVINAVDGGSAEE